MECRPEMNVAQAQYLGEIGAFIDVPGSVELGQEMRDAMDVADVAWWSWNPNRKRR